MAIRVFHCDDSRAFARLTRFWLEEHPDLAHVGAAHHGGEALDAIRRAQRDIVLLDSDGSLLAAIRAVAPRGARDRVLGYVRLLPLGALAPGADGYLARDDDERALVALIRELAGR